MAHSDIAEMLADLPPVPAPYTGRREVDLDVVRELLSHISFSDFEEAQELILHALQEVNELFGWVSPEAAELVATHLNTTINRVYGLLTFYADFRTEPRGHEHLLICHGMACYVRGSQPLVQAVQDRFGIIDGETTDDANVSVQVVNGCLGVCDRAPVVKLNDDYHGFVTAETLTTLLNNAIEGHARMTAKGQGDGHAS